MCCFPSVVSAMNTDPNRSFMSWNNAYNRDNDAYNSKIIEIIVSDQYRWWPSRRESALSRWSLRSALLLEELYCWLQSVLLGRAWLYPLKPAQNPTIISIIVKIMKTTVMQNAERVALYSICLPSCKLRSTVGLAMQWYVTQHYTDPSLNVQALTTWVPTT